MLPRIRAFMRVYGKIAPQSKSMHAVSTGFFSAEAANRGRVARCREKATGEVEVTHVKLAIRRKAMT